MDPGWGASRGPPAGMFNPQMGMSGGFDANLMLQSHLMQGLTGMPPMPNMQGPPPGANMGMGMMNPDMLGMMPQHDVGMGFDMSADGGGGYGRGRGIRGNQERGYYMPGRGPRGSSGPGIRERDLGVRGASRGDANDYCQHFVDTGQRPQNFLRDVHLTDRYAEYPKLKELVERKDALIAARATSPTFLKADLHTLPLSVDTFGTKFDVVLVDPPWEEYVRRAPGVGHGESWSWQEIKNLEIDKITDHPSFVFLWCGSAEGLDAGRHCLQQWGFRRCEDICWIKTNKEQRRAASVRQDTQAVLQHTKEHCLMGIKGTVRRTTDGHLIHANIDTDIIISEEPPTGSTKKPEELYRVIERFAQGRRRLELFGEDHNIRPGWVTVGSNLTSSNFNPQAYANNFRMADGSVYVSSGVRAAPGAPHLTGTSEEIETLRPRSPPPNQRH
ncbi:hypothetical protein ABBQ38_006775 [Trebouxia sp. C0009 RCD-2024]